MIPPASFRALLNVRPAATVLAGIILLSVSAGAAATITVHIEGLDDELQTAARSELELVQYAERQVSAFQVQRLFDDADEQIARGLEPYGYYHVRVEGDLQRGAQDGDFVATFRVTRGERVVVQELRTEVIGTGGELPAVQAALEAFEPKIGKPLDHGIYEGSKANVATVLQSHGYFDTKLERHRVAVSRGANSADIDLAWVSGERYRFAPVRFSDTQFPHDFLQRYVPWREGDFYTVDQLLTLQQRLVDADYFATVSVQPDLQNLRDGTVPIEALLIAAKRTVYKAGAYLSTDTGPGGRLAVDRRWLNDRGHKIGGEIEYSPRLEEYSVYYRIPKPGARNRNFNFAAGYRDEETDSSRSRMARIAAAETLDQWHGYTRTLGLQYLDGDFEIADEQRDTSLMFAEATLTRKRADNGVFPSRGLSITYGLRAAAEGVLSDTSLLQLRADAKWIRPVDDKSRLLLRAALGAMTVDDFDALPPELRFFAGGDRSVRGFDYQQIGEVNETGGVIGGRYLTVASAEYEYYFLERWGAAVFVDAGDAYNSQLDANVGAGIGVRWKSPVGIVRLDVAAPVVTDLDDGIRFHVLIGPDL